MGEIKGYGNDLILCQTWLLLATGNKAQEGFTRIQQLSKYLAALSERNPEIKI